MKFHFSRQLHVKQFGIVWAAILLSGCADIIYNSDRPKYHGPIVKPLWSVPGLAIAKPPSVYGGVVYVEPLTTDRAGLYAFDLKTGKQLWTARFPCREIKVVIGNLVLATDDQGLLHKLDSRTGQESGAPETNRLLSATAAGNLLYGIYQDRSVIAYDRPEHILWQAKVPMSVLSSALPAGGNVYVYGQLRGERNEKLGCAIHAFDAASGTLRWTWQTDRCSGLEESPMSDLAADADGVYIRIDTVQVDDKAGLVIALDAATGKQKWTSPTVQFHSHAPILFDAAAVAISDNIPGDHGGTANRKNPYILRGLDRATGQVKWESKTSWKYENWIAHDGLLFVADRMAHSVIGTGSDTLPDSFLTVVDIRSAKELWRSETIELGDFTSPVWADGIVIVGSSPFGNEHPQSAGLYAFRAHPEGK